MLVAGGMILTGTSISALARGIGRGLRAIFVGGAKGSEATARTVRQNSEEWRRAPRRTDRRDEGGADRRDERLPGRGRRELRPDRGAGRRQGRRHLRPGPLQLRRRGRHRRRRRSCASPSRSPSRAGARAGAAGTRAGRADEDAPQPDPDGQPARRHHLGGDRLPAAVPARARARQRRQGPRPERPAGDRPQADRSARPLRGRGEDRRRRQRPARLPLRTAPRSRHQSQESHRARERPRLRAGLDRHPHPRADPRQTGGRGRGAEREAPHGPPRRHLRGAPAEGLAAGRLARQGDRRQRGLDRHREDAARPRRRHHRLGQERLRQRDALLDPDGGLAERSAPGAGRPQAGRAQPLRERPAPADAGGDLAAARRQRPRQPDHRDGDALRRDVARPAPATSRS